MNQLESRCKEPVRGGQLYEILVYLQSGKRLTMAKALTELGVGALSQRIGDLKRMGWPIDSRMITVNSGARVSEYFYPVEGE